MNDGGPRLVKYGVAALLLGLYAALSAWMVANEGESYRKSIATKAEAVLSVEPEPVEPAKPPVDFPPEPSPAPAPQPIAPEPKPPVAPADRMPPPTPAPSPSPAVAKANPRVDPFWDEPEQKKVWDLDKLTAEDERALGAAIHRMILHADAEVVNGPLPKRVEDAAKPYLKAVNRKDLEYTFTVLDSPRLNVFSTPGGYIYVSRGLFDWIAEDEDYALGFILGHEIAHVDQAHAITCLRDPEVKQKLKLGTVLLFYAVMIPGGYLKQQDFEADKWAAGQMIKAGRSRYETLAFLRRLEDYARANGFENKRMTPRDKPEVPLLDNHIRAHPKPRDRLEMLKTFLDPHQKI